MNPNFQRLMSEATQLTRTGNLQAATAAIQAALRGDSRQRSRPADDNFEIIDVEMHEVPDTRPFNPPPFVTDTDTGTRARAPRSEAPAKGRFIAGHFAQGAMRGDYKLYIPAGAGERPLPLVVMLHGCTQNPDDFAAGTSMNEVAAAQDFFVLYPAQSQRANPQRCWNWFKHNHQRRGSGEPALLAGMTREVMAHHAIDADRVYVAGLSAGGAMAAILGETYPDLYAAVGVHSGLAAGVASDLPSALSAMKGAGTLARKPASGVSTIVFHGDADATVHLSNSEQVIAASVGAGTSTESQRVQRGGGRAYTRQVHRAPDGAVTAEYWLVHGATHAWSGGSTNGSYTDERGPDASVEMLRFFLEHPRRPAQR